MFGSQEHVFTTPKEREMLGNKLELARREKGLTQMELLEKSGLIKRTAIKGKWEGVTKGFMAYAEKGTRGITKQQLRSLAKVLGKPYTWFSSTESLSRAELKHLNEMRAADERTQRAQTAVQTRKMNRVGARTQKGTKESKVAQMGTARTRRAVKAPVAQAVVPKCEHHLTKADERLLKTVESYSEAQKDWVVSAVKHLLTRISNAK